MNINERERWFFPKTPDLEFLETIRSFPNFFPKKNFLGLRPRMLNNKGGLFASNRSDLFPEYISDSVNNCLQNTFRTPEIIYLQDTFRTPGIVYPQDTFRTPEIINLQDTFQTPEND